MSTILRRSLKVSLNLLNSGRSFNRNFTALSHQVYCVLFYGNREERRLTGKFHGTRLQQCRNTSFESIENYDSKIFEVVTSSTLSETVTSAIIEMHDLTGLPWWWVIILTAGVTKTVIGLPLRIYQNYLAAEINLTKQKFEQMAKELKLKLLYRAKKEKWDEKKKQKMLHKEVRKIWNNLVVENNCHPLKVIFLSLCQLPFWLILTVGIRNLASQSNLTESTQLGLQTEGVFWQTDLLLPDATYILPIIFIISNLMLIEINVLSNLGVWTMFSRFMNYFLRGFAVFGFYVTLKVPLCLSLFWVTSILFGLSQSLLLLSPRVKRFCRIPKTEFDCEKPYSNMWKKFIVKYSQLFKIFRK